MIGSLLCARTLPNNREHRAVSLRQLSSLLVVVSCSGMNWPMPVYV